MQRKIVTFGNETMNLGHAIAADLSLAGHSVTILDMPENSEKFENIKKQGGINVSGKTEALTSGKTGFAKIDLCTTDPKEALYDADIVFVVAPIHGIEKWVSHIAPFLRGDEILHFNYYGYWPSLRAYPVLKNAGKKDVAITECPSSLYYARGESGSIDFSIMKQGIPLSVFPARKTDEVFGIMNSLYPAFVKARNILETNFMNLNMLWHPSIALLNIAYFDRIEADGGDRANFYGTGITENTGILTDAQDKERIAACEAYNIPYRPLMDLIHQFSEGYGDTITEAQRDAKFVKESVPYPLDIWEQWIGWDMPFAMVPFVSLCELAGVGMPVHRSFIHIFGALLGSDFWETGATLDRLGLGGMTKEDVIRYVYEG